MNIVLIISSIISLTILFIFLYLLWDIRELLKKIANNSKSTFEETNSNVWKCPKCSQSNSNNSFSCVTCGYSLK